MRDCWLSIRGEIENLIKIHHDLGNALHKDMGIPLGKFKEDQGKLRRQVILSNWHHFILTICLVSCGCLEIEQRTKGS